MTARGQRMQIQEEVKKKHLLENKNLSPSTSFMFLSALFRCLVKLGYIHTDYSGM